MASPLKSLTQNLPGFIREPAVALIGQECYATLIYNLDLDDAACLRLTLSKVLGLGIVVGGGIVKVPQIVKILKSRSARGLSLSSYLLDTASLLFTVAYNVRLAFPISTYGENIALMIQNVVIICLIFYYGKARLALSTARGASSSSTTPYLPIAAFLTIILGANYVLTSNDLTPISMLRTGLWASIPLSSFAKVPQIVTNFRNGSTGQLSAFLVFNSLAGCVARLFTTSTETGDATLWWGFFSAAALNALIALQMAYYWNTTSPDAVKLSVVTDGRKEKTVSVSVPVAPSPKAATAPRLGSQGPTNRTTSPTGGKPISAARWQRKAE